MGFEIERTAKKDVQVEGLHTTRATFHSAVKSLKSKLVSLIMTLKGIPKIDKNKTTSINS